MAKPTSRRTLGGSGAPHKSEEASASALDALIDARTARAGGTRASDVRVGHLAGIDDEGRVLFRAGAEPPIPVSIALAISDGLVARAARTGERALVVRVGDGDDWMLVGLVRERLPQRQRRAGPGDVEVRVDGDKLIFEAERAIELRCGHSSLTLRKDGKIVLTGDYVVSASRGPNKIRGATISLN
jgi:hypothetical protein